MSKFFWVGEGVISFAGKDIEHGQELPADFPAESRDALLAKGKVSDQAPTRAAAAASVTAELGALRAALATKQGELDAAHDTIADLNTTIEKLTVQSLGGAPAAPAPEQAAGPKGNKK